MATISLYKTDGTQAGQMDAPDKVFAVELNPQVLHQAVLAQRANARQVLAHTKTRGEVSGTGKKPWRQKGTGRARHGSRRSPIWVGGGITFGPRKNRNFTQKLNRKVRRKAICMVLTERLQNDKFIGLEALTVEGGKTKVLKSVLDKLPSKGTKTLLVVEPSNKEARRAAQNLQGVQTIAPNSLNVVDLLKYKYIVAPKGEIEQIIKTFQ